MTTASKLALFFASALLFVLAAACDNALPGTPTAIPNEVEPGPTVAPEEAGVLPVRVMGRGTGMQNYMRDPRGTPFAILTPVANTTFKLEFTNRTGKDLKAWRGTLLFRDANGTEIEGFDARFAAEVENGSTVIVDYPIVHSDFIRARQTLREVPVSGLIVTFRPVSLIDLEGNLELIETPVPGER